MLWCMDPYARFKRGDVSKVAQASQRVERSEVACGRCKACIANRKQDWTGKLLMEAENSGSVAFLTLTYAKEPEGFEYGHIQAMLKSLRQKLARAKLGGVRFFCVGERGEKRDRVHWHLILFFQRNIQLQRPAMNTLWEHWPHGWTSIEMLKHSRIAKKIRYCVMYCLKGVGFNPGVRARCSLKPALGGEYVAQMARRCAQKGLCPNGKYQLPGIIHNQGRKQGLPESFTLQGANRRLFIEVYERSWVEFHPHKEQPVNGWLLKWQEAAVDPVFRKPRQFVADVPLRLRPRVKSAEACKPRQVGAVRYLVGAGWSALVSVRPDGAGRIEADDWTYQFEWSVEEVLDLPRDVAVRIDKWVALQRPQGWMPRDFDGEKIQAEAEKRQRQIALGEVLEHSRQRLRNRHGTIAGAGGIFGRPYNPALPEPFWLRSKARYAPPVVQAGPHDLLCAVCRKTHDPRKVCAGGEAIDYALASYGFSTGYDLDSAFAQSLPF